MDENIQKIVEDIQEKFKLEDYFLKRYHIYHEKRSSHQTAYILSMEWFPNPERDKDEDGLNPEGTVAIEIDFHNKDLYRLIFVGGVSHPQAKEIFPAPQKAEVIEWVENITHLTFGKQFKIDSEKDNEFRFLAAVDHIPIAPIGVIQVEFNDKNELTLFSIDGLFPTEDKVNWEPFSLLPENLEHLFKQQLKLIEIPIEENKKWLPIYMTEELYVRNQGEQTLSYGSWDIEIIDIILEWSAPLNGSFKPKEDVDLSTEVAIEQAIENKAHPDSIPISEVEKDAAINGARDFLRQQFPNESDKWLLHSIYRNSGYIICELKPLKESARAFLRKIKVIMNRETLEIINYVDNEMLLDMFANYEKADDVSITKDEAFKKLRTHFKVTPTYLYNPEEDMYYLYGQVDSKYGVIATTEEVVHLDEL